MGYLQLIGCKNRMIPFSSFRLELLFELMHTVLPFYVSVGWHSDLCSGKMLVSIGFQSFFPGLLLEVYMGLVRDGPDFFDGI